MSKNRSKILQIKTLCLTLLSVIVSSCALTPEMLGRMDDRSLCRSYQTRRIQGDSHLIQQEMARRGLRNCSDTGLAVRECQLAGFRPGTEAMTNCIGQVNNRISQERQIAQDLTGLITGTARNYSRALRECKESGLPVDREHLDECIAERMATYETQAGIPPSGGYEDPGQYGQPGGSYGGGHSQGYEDQGQYGQPGGRYESDHSQDYEGQGQYGQPGGSYRGGHSQGYEDQGQYGQPGGSYGGGHSQGYGGQDQYGQPGGSYGGGHSQGWEEPPINQGQYGQSGSGMGGGHSQGWEEPPINQYIGPPTRLPETSGEGAREVSVPGDFIGASLPQDGSSIKIKSHQANKLVSVDQNGRLLANNQCSENRCLFRVKRLGGNKVSFTSEYNRKVVRAGIGKGSALGAVSAHVKGWETFEWVKGMSRRNAFSLRAVQNGKYVRAGIGKKTALGAVSTHMKGWEMFTLKPVHQ